MEESGYGRTMTKNSRTFLLALAFGAGVSILATPAAAAERAPITVNTYELPAEITAARADCYEAERDGRGIPALGSDAYVTWWSTTDAGARNAWTRAFDGCTAAHPMPGGTWNFAGMTLVKTEIHP